MKVVKTCRFAFVRIKKMLQKTYMRSIGWGIASFWVPVDGENTSKKGKKKGNSRGCAPGCMVTSKIEPCIIRRANMAEIRLSSS